MVSWYGRAVKPDTPWVLRAFHSDTPARIHWSYRARSCWGTGISCQVLHLTGSQLRAALGTFANISWKQPSISRYNSHKIKARGWGTYIGFNLQLFVGKKWTSTFWLAKYLVTSLEWWAEWLSKTRTGLWPLCMVYRSLASSSLKYSRTETVFVVSARR